MSGSYYYDKYEYFNTTGTVINPEYIVSIQKDVSKERILICGNCNSQYLLNMDLMKSPLFKLHCESCGAPLKFRG